MNEQQSTSRPRRFIHFAENPLNKNHLPILVTGRAVLPVSVILWSWVIIGLATSITMAIIQWSMGPIGIFLLVTFGSLVLFAVAYGVCSLIDYFRKVNNAYKR